MKKFLYTFFIMLCSVVHAETISPKFTVVTTPNTTTFSFNMTASGNFTVDWGDGNTENIIRTNTTEATYTHTYDIAGEYTIGFDGVATKYALWGADQGYWASPTISFQNNKNIAGIYGSLGALFPTIDGNQPEYYSTFSGCSNLASEIPPELFAGNYGQMKAGMFNGLFSGCSKLRGQIPPGLFSGITGNATHIGFSGTFLGCSKLTGEIPEDLFGGITGLVRDWCFNSVFNGCSGLTGEIPEKLFSRIVVDSSVHRNIFNQAFRNCKNLTGFIPPGLFAGMDADKVSWGEAMFTGSGIAKQCPSGYYQYMTGFEEYLGGYVSCVPCPDDFPNSVVGATDVQMCYYGDVRKLHVDNDSVGLLTYKTTEPALHIKLDGNVYYGAISPIETNIMRDSTKKFKIRYNDTIYHLYDVTTIIPDKD